MVFRGHSSQAPILRSWTNTTTRTIALDAKEAAKSQQQITNRISVKITSHAQCAAETEIDDEYRTKRHSCR
jgi:hypothetical protein